MSAKLLAVFWVLLVCAPCQAYPVSHFEDLDTFIDQAQDIVVARCGPAPLKAEDFGDGLTAADVQVLLVLKGHKNLGALKVVSADRLKPGETYLLTSTGGMAGGTDFIAIAELSVVPLPADFDLAILKGKSIKEAMHRLMARRLNTVEWKLAPLLEEQTLLTKALKDRTDDLFKSRGPIRITAPREVMSQEERSVRYLEIGSKRFEWSHSRPGETGFVYYTSIFSPPWEFAESDKQDLQNFDGKSLEAKFYGLHSPGKRGNSMYVKVGQVILGRTVDDPQTIYIIKFVSQEKGKETVTVQYAVVGAGKHD